MGETQIKTEEKPKSNSSWARAKSDTEPPHIIWPGRNPTPPAASLAALPVKLMDHQNIWRSVIDNGKQMYICNVCQDGRQRNDYHLARHENTSSHQANLAHFHFQLQGPVQQPEQAQPQDGHIPDDALRSLLSSLTGGVTAPYPEAARNGSPPPRSGIDWNLMEANDEGHLSFSAEQQAVASIAEAILESYGDLPISDDEFEESTLRLLIGSPKSMDTSEESHSRKRARTKDPAGSSRFWHPWPDRITCTLNILMHLPRSVFSQRQLDLFLWLLKVNNVDDVPSVNIPYDGALGHKYYVNSLAQIIAQEMSNSKVRPHLHFYPEDSGPKLSEARQGERWLHELPDKQTTPMARISGKDYYIHEPAILDDGQYVIPTRWFTKDSQMFAKCWEMQVVTREHSSGWRVLESQNYIVPAAKFLSNFINFQTDAARYGVPHPSHIVDVVDLTTMTSSPWKYTNPVLGNSWRAKAEGHRVLVFPLWVYCDDTSGNVSKKWNEHNSFLMTPAELPREEAQKEYNIHFLCTSNLARPLEMLAGIVDQLEQAQEDGIWAWDLKEEEPVLIIPEVLALLGDNPMQSEFTCHIGLCGKLFCRACWVKGTDAMDADDDDNHGAERQDGDDGRDEGDGPGGPASDAGSAAGSDVSDAGSEASPEKKKKKGPAKKVRESMAQMIERVKNFVKARLELPLKRIFHSPLSSQNQVGRLRNKDETTEKLRSYFSTASTLNTKTKLKNLQTENGIKDKYQTHFIQQLFESYKGKRGTAAKQAALDAKIAKLPPQTTSPVWRIKANRSLLGLDPHQDTPVEILHVILLGFVKYLWRDLVQLQLNNKDAKKELLATRLSSFDVSGLGISPLAGKTLVKYSGSLTGRDFRAIAQVAPFVVYDLVSEDCFKTWQALSKIIPLIWQPDIEDIESHIALLTKEIEHFLLCAARWTNRWFNKPKFHIFVHLPAHIRRFGPAILFATEAFESFNAIIRAKSVHSNRHAPSRDIAQVFAQGNRIRHLLSGGLFMLRTEPETPAPTLETQTPTIATTATRAPPDVAAIDTPTLLSRVQIKQSTKSDWDTVGPGPQSLIAAQSTVTSYLGLDKKKTAVGGICISDKQPPRPIPQTLTGVHMPEWTSQPGLFQTSQSLSLTNGDTCGPGHFVIVQNPHALGQTFVARVEEIIQQTGSVAALASEPDGILLQQAYINPARTRYGMPSIQLLNHWSLHKTKDLICTVNVQHNCIENRCGPTGTRPVYQERTKSTLTRSEIAHKQNIEDVVLNTAQMRDAVHTQRFRVPSDTLDLETIIYHSALKEVNARKAGEPTPSELLASNPKRPATASAAASRPAVTSSAAISSTSTQPRPAPRRVSALQGQ
ncbi:hypothetical protein K438DRAFT_1762221 [Mycena galopus ATCC 62051]|nr:hypothetical protein K438DRAFT_1762221 [Mycena galopus ATCC 62051]